MSKISPILITGVPRSGGSMIAAVINTCGAFGGDMSVKNDPKRGMYENFTIRETIVKPYLASKGLDVMGHYPLPILEQVSIPSDWRDWVNEIMPILPWMYKDSRSALLWNIWDFAYPDAKWVIVRRRTGDIITSCIKTGFMKTFKNPKLIRDLGFKTEAEGWLWMVHEYEKKFVEMINAGLNVKVIYPERLNRNDYTQLFELLEWLGLPWNEEALKCIKPLIERA